MKRFTAFALALIMMLTLSPVAALAEMIPARYEMSLHYVAEDDGISNDELFDAYAQRVFDEVLGNEAPSVWRSSALEEGTLEKEIYDALKAKLARVAAGTATSTEITVIPANSWSLDELGVTSFVADGALTAEANDAITEKLRLIYTCLLADCTVELYWHDKTPESGGVTLDASGITIDSSDKLSIGSVTYSFAVATDYSATGTVGTYTTNINKTSAATSAVANAKAIVTANASKSDLEKLTAYRDKICELVSYDASAAASNPSVEGINPWQMIYVFDDDEDTNVVCEGYAKAFQFLCDLSSINDVECHTVSGTMSGGTGAGRHMWNVVTMDDGRNYLVDVTNCDVGTIGAPDKLFMAYTANSADAYQTHTFTIGRQNITFTYDETMEGLFCEGYLDLATTAYKQSAAASASLSGNSSVQTGTDVTLKLKVSGTNIMGIEASLDYDEEVLEFRSYSGLLSGWDVVLNGSKFVMYGVKNPINEASDVVSVTFRVKNGTAAGTQLSVAFKDIVVSDGNADTDVGTATWNSTVASVPAAALTGRNSVKPCEWVTLIFAISGDNIIGFEATLDYDSSLLEQTYTNYYYNIMDDGIGSGSTYVLEDSGNPFSSPTAVLELGFSIKEYAPANALLSVSFKDIVLFDGTNEIPVDDATWNGTVDGTVEARWGYATGTNRDQAPVGNNWVGSGSLASAQRFANNVSSATAYIQLLENVDIAEALSFDEVTILDLNGKTIDRGLTEATYNGCVIDVYGNLTLCDTSTTAAGKLTGGNNEVAGAGVWVAGGAFTMNGGSICKNANGGVFVEQGTFVMNGGSIYNNTGYGVVNNGNFVMNGGTISENDGGVFVWERRPFTLNAGAICDNTNLGGVLSNGSFTMNGGTIFGNTATYGGGVLTQQGTFVMTDGAIFENTSDACGGAVYIGSSTFTMTGGTITENTASAGSGVYVGGGGINISGTPYIFGNMKNDTMDNIFLKDRNMVITVVDELKDGAAIGVSKTPPADATPTTVAVGDSASGYTLTESDTAKFISDEGYSIILDANNNVIQMKDTSLDANAIAYIEGDVNTTYSTLQTAINAASNGDTIKMLGDYILRNTELTISKSIAFDLGSHNFDVKKSAITGNLVVANGCFTLSDDSCEIDGDFTANSGTVNIKAGTITGEFTVAEGADCSISSGTFLAATNDDVAQFLSSDFAFYLFKLVAHPKVENDEHVCDPVDGTSSQWFTMYVSNGASVETADGCFVECKPGVTASFGRQMLEGYSSMMYVVGHAPFPDGDELFTIDIFNDEHMLITMCPTETYIGLVGRGTATLIYWPICNLATAQYGLAGLNGEIPESNTLTTGTITEALIYANSLSSGTAYIRLLEDVTTKAPITFASGKTTILDLNGYDIDRGLTAEIDEGNVLTVNGHLTICDNSATATTNPGKITGGYDWGGAGGAIIEDGGNLTITSGSISGNNSLHGTGGVDVCGGGVLTMTGGSIADNTSTNCYGGVVVSGQGMFNMTGGTLTGNKGFLTGAVFLACGDIYGNPGGVLNMSGGTITGNMLTSVNNDYGAGGVSGVSGASINISGNASIIGNFEEGTHPSNIWLKSDGLVNVVGSLAGSFGVSKSWEALDATMPLRLVAQGTSDYAITVSDAAKFTSDNGHAIHLADNMLYLAENTLAEARYGWAGPNGEFMPETWISGTLTEAVAYANGLASGTAYIQLRNDVEIAAPLVFAYGKTTILDLNGYNINRGLTEATSGGNVLAVNGNLTICDTSENAKTAPGKITGGYNNHYGGGVIVDGGVLTMNGGSIFQNKTISEAWSYGGGVYVTGNGSFIMNHGTISGNTSSREGGGVYINHGAFILNDGSISENTVIDQGSGGVGINSYGTFTMNGGTISENIGDQSGGVYVYGGTFTMNNGIISKNVSNFLGGGVDVVSGTFTMTGGTISENSARAYGGGIYVGGGGNFTMSGGIISKNLANLGAGVNVDNVSSFVMTDGTISENTASYTGGGVNVHPNSTFTMNAGSIKNNDVNSPASNLGGGGVCVWYDSTFTMNGGTISGNTANYNGGGVMAYDAFVMTGGSISGNKAKVGGGVCIWTEGTMQISGTPAISGNTANSVTNNVYLSGDNAITVTGAFGDGASIGVTTSTTPTSAAPITVALGGSDSAYTLTERDAAKISSDEGYVVHLVLDEGIDVIVFKTMPTAKLGTTSGSLNLFDDSVLPISVECNYDILSATFANEDLDEVFKIDVTDDGTLQVIPKAEKPETMTWAALGKTMAGTYKSAIKVEYSEGNYCTTEELLTIKLTAKAPVVKASAVKFNSFYTGDTQQLVLTTTNGIVARVAVDESKATSTAPACPAWITLNDDLSITLNNKKLLNNKGSGKLNLEVWLDGWRAPAQVAVSVSAAYTAPKLKISATSLSLSNNTVPEGVPMTLLSADKKFSLADLNVVSLRAANEVDLAAMSEANRKTYAGSTAVGVIGFDSETGVFNLTVNGRLVNGKVLLIAAIKGASAEVTIPLTIKVIDRATLKASTTKVTLNTAMGVGALRDEKVVTFSTNAQGFWFGAMDWSSVTDSNGRDCSGELDISFIHTTSDTFALSFHANEDTVEGKTYKVTVYVEGTSKPVVITVTAKATLPTVKLSTKAFTLHKDKGFSTIDISGLDGYDVKKLIVDAPSEVNVSGDGKALSVNLTSKAIAGKTYKVNISYELTCGLRTKPVAVSVKAVDKIAATATVKGNMDVTRPGNTSSNFTFKYTGWYPGEYNDAAYEPTLVWEVYAVNGKNKIADYEEYDFVNGKGSLVASSDDNNGGWFCDIDDAEYGVVLALNTDEVGAWKNGEVNPKYAYTVEAKLVFDDGIEIASKPVKMTVKQGSVKFAADVKAVDIFKQAEAESEPFSIKKTDKDADNVADIAKVAVAASKTPSAFEVIETGDGYAIKVVNPTIAKSGTVKLNIWLEGNYEEGCEEIWDTKSPEYRKPNATVSLKVNVK